MERIRRHKKRPPIRAGRSINQSKTNIINMETGSEYLVRKIIENHWDEYSPKNSERKPNVIFQPKIPIHKLLEYKENAFNIDYEIIKAVHDAGRRGVELSEFLTNEI